MIVLYIRKNAGKSATAGTNNSSYIANSWVATEVPPTQGTQDRHTAKKLAGRVWLLTSRSRLGTGNSLTFFAVQGLRQWQEHKQQQDSSKCRDDKNRIDSASKDAVQANNSRDASINKVIIRMQHAGTPFSSKDLTAAGSATTAGGCQQ
jgi:hypothetical protein